MDFIKRNQQIYCLRKQGKTYKQIGQEMSISTERARQIYMNFTKKSADEKGLEPLSTRVLNAIKRGGVDSKEELIQSLKSKEGLKVRNVGDFGIKEIEELIHKKIERSNGKYYVFSTCRGEDVYVNCSFLKIATVKGEEE